MFDYRKKNSCGSELKLRNGSSIPCRLHSRRRIAIITYLFSKSLQSDRNKNPDFFHKCYETNKLSKIFSQKIPNQFLTTIFKIILVTAKWNVLVSGAETEVEGDCGKWP